MNLINFEIDSSTGRNVNSTLPTIAYAFNAYRGDMWSIPVSLAAIFDSENVYCVQLDASVTSGEASELKELIVKNILEWNRGDDTDHACKDANCVESRLIVTTGRFSITYAGVSEPLATLDAIEELLEFDSEWDFFVNLTPLDYPLGLQSDIRRYLADARNFSFTGHHSNWAKPTKPGSKQFTQWHQNNFDKSLLFPRDNSNDKLVLHRMQKTLTEDLVDSEFLMLMQGEAYGILHRSFCKYAITSPLSRRVIALLSHASVVSEKMIPTILYNSNLFHHCPSTMRGNTKAGGPHFNYTERDQDISRLPKEATVEFLSRTGLLFYRKFPQILDYENQQDLADAYTTESYRSAIRQSFRDTSSQYTFTWRLASTKKGKHSKM